MRKPSFPDMGRLRTATNTAIVVVSVGRACFFFTENLENQNAITPHNLIELVIKLTIPQEKVYKFCDPLTVAGVKILKKT